MRHFYLTDDTRSRASGERAKQLPVPSSHESFLLHGLQSGHLFRWNKTPKGLRGMLHERFHPPSNASCFPERRRGRLMHHCLKMVMDSVTGQGKGWLVPFVVKFEIAGRTPVAKGVIGACKQDRSISYLNAAVFCHNQSRSFHLTTGSPCHYDATWRG